MKCWWCENEAEEGKLTCGNIKCSETHAQNAKMKRGKAHGTLLTPEEAAQVRKDLGIEEKS